MALVADFGFDSFDYTEEGFTAYIPEEQALQVSLSELRFDDFTYSYDIEKIAPTNWNAEWEKNFEPVKVDNLLVIRAPFHVQDPSVQLNIVIMPKMSFGTGHHQTTRLMCRELFGLPLAGRRLLDMGCGTGVLAIAAKKLGAADVLGIDIDEWSVENSMENCTVNGCSDIVIKKGDVALLNNEALFDVILANINKNILKADMPHYAGKLGPGGQLLLSGFFTTDVEELKAVAARHSLSFKAMRHENEWAMMVLEKM
jgi:ribosomal protein L11 methyltransferase